MEFQELGQGGMVWIILVQVGTGCECGDEPLGPTE